MSRLRQLLFAITATISLIVIPSAANAALLACDGSGGMVAGTELYSDSTAAGTGACTFQVDIEHIASQVICNFVIILNSVLGKVYCGIQFSMMGVLKVLLTLYVAVFGVQLLMGMAQLNARDIITRLIKIAAVWTFATQSAWGINIVFEFFMGLINDGSAWVVNSVRLSHPEGFPVTEDATGGIMPTYSYIDSLIYSAVIGPFTSANDRVTAFFLAMMIPFTPLLMMAAYWLYETFMLLINTVVSFMLALSAIAFLITLSPIFLSFMLFKATSHFFESWLRYMTSYALQVIIVFAILAMWITVNAQFVTFFNQLDNMVWDYDPTLIVGSAVLPTDTVAICPPIFTDGGRTAGCEPGFDPDVWQDDFEALIPPSAIAAHGDILYFVIFHLITLIIIAYSFSQLLSKASGIAQQLAGSGHVPVLSGGWGGGGFGRMTAHRSPNMISPGQGSGNFVQNLLPNIANRD